MPAAIVAGVMGSAFLATTAGAIAVAAVTGVMVGGAIGAATAIMTKGDILQGTLKGALIGGITGGAASYLSSAGAVATTGVEAAVQGTAAEVAAAGGGDMAANVAANDVFLAGTEGLAISGGGSSTPGLIASAGGGSVNQPPEVPIPGGSNAPITGDQATQQMLAKLDANAANSWKAPVYAGMAQGAGTGLIGLVTANKSADKEKELLEMKYAQQQNNIAAPGFQDRISRFEIPDAWKKEMIWLDKYRLPTPGILQGGAA
jgi:hypothetical protein